MFDNKFPEVGFTAIAFDTYIMFGLVLSVLQTAKVNIMQNSEGSLGK